MKPADKYLNWEHIREVAKINPFIESCLLMWNNEPDMTAEEILMSMVLIQDNALKNIEQLQSEGWQYFKGKEFFFT